MLSPILARYLLREHAGPFGYSLSVITMIFLLDLLFRSLNRILSKGLPWSVVLEFLGLNMAWIIATAVPMAVLTATLMAFGRLAADNEIAAMQANGVSPIRQVMPLFGAAALLAVALIWFNDNVLPKCNFRVRTLATEIMRSKPSVRIEPGIWFNEIPHFGLLAHALDDSAGVTKASGLLIDDNSLAEVRRTISARRGLIQSNSAEGALLLTLFQGEIQEINLAKPAEFRRLAFSKHVMAIGAKEMAAPANEVEARNDREKSTAEMWSEVEAIRQEIARRTQQLNLVLADKSGRARAEILAEKRQLEIEAQVLLVEIQKKYAIPCACLVFILIGAPLGTLARSGGIAMSGGLSLGFFLFYWACLIGGEALADRRLLSPFFAMWSPNFITGILGVFVFRTVAAGNLAPPSSKLSAFLRALFAGKKAEQRPPMNENANALILPPAPQSARTKHELELFEFDVVEPEFVQRPSALNAIATLHAPASSSLPKVQRLEKTLQELVARARLEFALLSDRNGVILAQGSYQSSHGLAPQINFNQMAALAATQMAIVQVLGKALDEEGEFTCLFQGGERYNLFIYEIDQKLILTVLVERKVAVGLVRIHANEAVASLREILTPFHAAHV
ncbi:LptF/LptG family permease [candidate division KSB1 bacterium]|nr:LptF/LptG family permease [candidate division KSB1 bacterium]